MSTPIQTQEIPPVEETAEIEIIEDVNDAAEHDVGLGCGDDNPYR